MDQNHSAMQDSPKPATGTFALDLSREGITLYWLSSHAVWNAVEHVVLQDGEVAEPMAQLRARMGGQPEPARVDVWLPEEQVLVRVLDTGGGLPTEAAVAALFADISDPLEFDAAVRAGGNAYTIAAISRAVLEQTRAFLEPHGFVVDNYTVRDAPAGMDYAPVFPLTPPQAAAGPARAVPPRAALAAAGAGLIIGGGLLAGVLMGAFGDGGPEVSTAALQSPAGPPAVGEASSVVSGAMADGAARVPGAGDITSAGVPVTFAEPANPLSVGRAQIDLPLPAPPILADTVGALPLQQAAPLRGASPRLEPVATDAPGAPAIYAKPVQTEIATLIAPAEEPRAAPPPAARLRPGQQAFTLPADWLAPAAGAGSAPDLSALREVPQPDVLVLDPTQGEPADAQPAPVMPGASRESYVASLFGDLDAPGTAPATADVSGVRSRPASVPPPNMVSLSAPDPAGDPAAMAPPPQAAVTRHRAAAAPVSAERTGPLAEFAPSGPLSRPVLTAPPGSRAAPADDVPPTVTGPEPVRSAPAKIEYATLGIPSAALPPADLSAVRAPAKVSVAIDWMPVQPAPAALSGPPPQPAAESALNAILLDILAAVPAEMAGPLIGRAERQPMARVATDGTRPEGGETQRVAALTAAPAAGTRALNPPAVAVQPLDLDTPRAVDTHDELAKLLSPANGVQIDWTPGPWQGLPQADPAPQVQLATDAGGTVADVSGPAAASAAPEPVELVALGSTLPRARVAPRGTVPELPDIEFVALDRSLGADDTRPRGTPSPTMAAPSEAPGAVSVPLPAPPPSGDGAGIAVAVFETAPGVIPPLRPEPQVIAARPDVVPPLRGAPEVIEATPDVVPPLRDEDGQETEVAALSAPAAVSEATDDGADPTRQPAGPQVIPARPDVVPPLRGAPEVIEAAPDVVPPLRDEDGEETEVAALSDPDSTPEMAGDGSDLALPRQIRPRPRPPEVAEAETARMASLAPSELALNRTDSPRRRPSDLARAAPEPAPAAPAAPPAASAPEPKRAAPELPTTASVARAATIKNALPFGRMTLIGVFGSQRNRHAIVRLRSGDFVKVQNGESLDGYQITGMSNNAIRLRRGGRETLLVIPQ